MAAGVDGVVGVALVEAAKQCAVHGGFGALGPLGVEHLLEELAVELIHGVVVAVELGGGDDV